MRKRSTTKVARLTQKAMTMESARKNRISCVSLTAEPSSARNQGTTLHRASASVEVASLLAVTIRKVSSKSFRKKGKCVSSFFSADCTLNGISGLSTSFLTLPEEC